MPDSPASVFDVTGRRSWFSLRVIAFPFLCDCCTSGVTPSMMRIRCCGTRREADRTNWIVELVIVHRCECRYVDVLPFSQYCLDSDISHTDIFSSV